MTARDDYPTLAGYAGLGSINGRPHQTETGKEFARALDALDAKDAENARLRTVVDAAIDWRRSGRDATPEQGRSPLDVAVEWTFRRADAVCKLSETVDTYLAALTVTDAADGEVER